MFACEIGVWAKLFFEPVLSWIIKVYYFFAAMLSEGGAVAQLVERVTPGEAVVGSIPVVAARSLLVGSVSL